MPIHVFFDNSNIWGGAQALRIAREPSVPWVALRIYYRNLFELIEGGRQVGTAVLAGSVPPSCEALWEYARQQGYNTDLLKRIQKDDGTVGEQGVDEVLHLKIANALLDHAPPQTLIIATGDGRTSEFGTGFSKQAERALRANWSVEVWTFSPTCNGCYPRMEQSSGGQLTVHHIDPCYDSVTFVKGGQYYQIDGQGNKVFFAVNDRVVAPLPQRNP